jgi:hypothetical protein
MNKDKNNDLIKIPKCFIDFIKEKNINKDNITWNDLNRKGKEKLASKVKKSSSFETIKTSPNASIENIIKIYNLTNPIITEISSRYGIEILNYSNFKNLCYQVYVALQLRKTRFNYNKFFHPSTGAYHYKYWASVYFGPTSDESGREAHAKYQELKEQTIMYYRNLNNRTTPRLNIPTQEIEIINLREVERACRGLI